MADDYTFILKDPGVAPVHQINLVCLTDADAMLIARGVAGGRDVEVWDQDRLVGKVCAGAPHNAAPVQGRALAS